MPWARKGSAFTLLFEQTALTLAREMPVNAAARIIGIGDKRLWRIVQHYVSQAVAQLDLSKVQAIGLDETASKRGLKGLDFSGHTGKREVTIEECVL